MGCRDHLNKLKTKRNTGHYLRHHVQVTYLFGISACNKVKNQTIRLMHTAFAFEMCDV